jgi:TetR/AcrR family transcriptional regulator, transcriptional repressor for nem operon
LNTQQRATVKTETRTRLVEAARTLFWEQGYANTGIAQILKAADALSGSLYYFFPTKEDLLLAVLETYKGLLWPMVVQPVFDRVSDPIERVFGILDGYRHGLLATDFRYGCPIGNLALEVGNELPAVRGLIADNFTGWCKVIEKCLEESGRLPTDLDRAELARFVLNTMEGAMMLARTYRDIEPFDSAVTQLRDYVDRLLRDGSEWTAPRRPKQARRQVRKR